MDAVDRSHHFDAAALNASALELPCVLLCSGKSCRKAKGYDELRASIGALAEVKTVKCIDVCEGPVVGVKLNGKTLWFERMRSDKVRAAVVTLLHQHRIPKKLRPHRV